jgi:hypothetical protein
MVYGVITGADIEGVELDDGYAAVLIAVASIVNDTPFCFRIRVEDDSIAVKDFKWGGFGSQLWTQILNDGNMKENLNALSISSNMISGKYKVDLNPEKNLTVPPGKSKNKHGTR